MSIGVAFVFIGVGMLAAGLLAGVFGFTPSRSAATVAAESDDPDQIEVVVERISAAHRKFIPARRTELDRHPDYVATLLGVSFLSLGLTLGRVPHGTALFGIPPLLQHALATGMGISAVFGLFGIVLRLKDNRLSYTLGLCASLGIMLAMGSYEVMIVSHSDLIGTLGGGLALSITGARMWMVPRFWREIASLNRLRDRIAEQLNP